MPPRASQPLPEGFRVESYTIRGLVARGGFSFVYVAHDQSDAPVALKEYFPATLAARAGGSVAPVVPPEHGERFRLGMRCFLEEATVLARISHRNVVRVRSFVRANGTAYLAMCYERGRTLLEHILKAGRRLSEEWIRGTFGQLLNGLREVHSARLLHLDLKPQNLFMRNDGSPVLIDFGAARRTPVADDPRLPPVFTPGFAPPELHEERHRLGPWSDIYSIGACMYACVAGEGPPSAQQRARRDDMISARCRGAGRYSAELLDTIDWCLRPSHLERPQSVLTLQKALRGEPQPQAGETAPHGGSRRGLLRFALR
jgi:serine/threonine protein kinase